MSEAFGSAQLFHPKGVRVTFPLSGDVMTYKDKIDALLAQGWAVREPGLEAGEESDTVGWVLHGSYTKDGETTPYVLLYSTKDAYTHSFLKVYLNSPADVAAFEYASKLKLESISEYVGDNKPERGKNPKLDAAHLKAPPTPFGVVFKANPKYSQADAEAARANSKVYPVPKRVFVRWAEQMPAGATNGTAHASDVDDYARWKEYVGSYPTAASITQSIEDVRGIKDKALRERVQLLLTEHCRERQLKWDAATRSMREPVLAGSPGVDSPF